MKNCMLHVVSSNKFSQHLISIIPILNRIHVIGNDLESESPSLYNSIFVSRRAFPIIPLVNAFTFASPIVQFHRKTFQHNYVLRPKEPSKFPGHFHEKMNYSFLLFQWHQANPVG